MDWFVYERDLIRKLKIFLTITLIFFTRLLCHLLYVEFTELLNSVLYWSLPSLGMLLVLSQLYDKYLDFLSDTSFMFHFLLFKSYGGSFLAVLIIGLGYCYLTYSCSFCSAAGIAIFFRYFCVVCVNYMIKRFGMVVKSFLKQVFCNCKVNFFIVIRSRCPFTI